MTNHEQNGESIDSGSGGSWDSVTDYGKEHPFGTEQRSDSDSETEEAQISEVAENDAFFAEGGSPDLGAEGINEVTSQAQGKEVKTPQLVTDYDKDFSFGEQVGQTIITRPESATHEAMRQEKNQKEQDRADADYLKSHYIRSSMRGDLGDWDYSRMSEEDKADALRKKQLMEMGFYDAKPLDFKPEDYKEKYHGPLDKMEDARAWEELTTNEQEWHNGWFLTEQGGEWLDKKVIKKMRKDNPDVFKPSKELVAQRIGKVVEELRTDESKEELMKFAELFGSGKYSEAVAQAAVFFSNVYGLKDVPSIRMQNPNGDISGAQDSDAFTIVTNIRTTPWNFLNTLSHELWHARQHQAVDDREPGSELLMINSQNYQMPDNGAGYRPYFTQLLEAEAHTVGESVGKTVRRNMPMSKRIKYGLQKYRKPKIKNTPDATPSTA